MDETMQAAIAQANATRPRTSHQRTLADAHLAYRVALADAEQTMNEQIQRVMERAARAQASAERTLAVADARAHAVAAHRSAQYARVRYCDDTRRLVQEYEYAGLLLSDQYAQFADHSKRPELVCQRRMLARELRRRGVL